MNRIEEIDAQIEALRSEKEEIQNACSHPPLCTRYKYESNTGNWDRSDDSYWTKVHCTLCGKRWIVESSPVFGKGAVKVERGEEL